PGPPRLVSFDLKFLVCLLNLVLQPPDSGAFLPGTHCSERHGYSITSSAPAIRLTGVMEDLPGLPDQSALTPANFTTLPHFSVSSTMSLPKSLGEPVSAMPPRSASSAFILGSATPASISLLSLSMISTGVLLGAPTPNQPLAS